MASARSNRPRFDPAEMDRAANMAKRELFNFYAGLEFDERAAFIWLGRWYQKWHLVSSSRRLGRLLLDLANLTPEVPHE